MTGNFLSRWSRRKRTARRGEDQAALQSDDPARRIADVARGHAREPQAPASGAPVTPEEIAALPKVDDLTADSDISGFLRRGVPDHLRNAALRRIWMLDPAIRDFAGHARDYAYDWNTPGGVPGNGPLPPDADVAEMLGQILGGPDPDAPAAEVEGQRVSPDHRVAPGPAVDDARRAAVPEDGTREEPGPSSADDAAEAAPPLDVAGTTAAGPAGAKR